MMGPQADAAEPEIRRRLGELAAENGVTLLFAAEAGSRAWGFPSPDSDYDIRFIYKHPVDWYLSVNEERDVIDWTVESLKLDFSGWDLRKCLRLALRSNPHLYEWLESPIVYADQPLFSLPMRGLTSEFFSRNTLAEHYLGTARKKYGQICANPDSARLKHYFYTIRPLSAVLWLHTRPELPPVPFQALLDGLEMPEPVRQDIARLVELKAGAAETTDGRRMPLLDAWIEDQLGRAADRLRAIGRSDVPRARIDGLFRELLA